MFNKLSSIQNPIDLESMMEYDDESNGWEKADASRSEMEWFSAHCFKKLHTIALKPLSRGRRAVVMSDGPLKCFQNRPIRHLTFRQIKVCRWLEMGIYDIQCSYKSSD
jgi:hypothetical protein